MSDTTKDGAPDSVELSYEQAREQLSEIVTKLESGNTPLANALALWERGEQLAAHCQSILDAAREKIAQRSDENN
ncbi:MAG: exodeoxyribonuclease VII small subunit [Propionibacterium sp.]|nr:MAG: exodeoxyribonuclease VII small subunit [Propionibacterium sp.]